jgi:hypothetical protein
MAFLCLCESNILFALSLCIAGNNTELTKFARANGEPLREIYCWAHGTYMCYFCCFVSQKHAHFRSKISCNAHSAVFCVVVCA